MDLLLNEFCIGFVVGDYWNFYNVDIKISFFVGIGKYFFVLFYFV